MTRQQLLKSYPQLPKELLTYILDRNSDKIVNGIIKDLNKGE